MLLAGLLVSVLGWYRGYAGAKQEFVTLGYGFGFYHFREFVWGYSLLVFDHVGLPGQKQIVARCEP